MSRKTIPLGSSEEQERLSELEQQIQKVEGQYVDYAERNLNYRKVSKQTPEIKKTNRLFCLALAGCCLTPLRNGVNAKSVLRVIGLWVGCCVLSKQFREATGEVIGKAFGPMISKKVSQAEPDSLLRTRQALVTKDGEELPLIPESVAVMQIAFCRQAYADMRKEGADKNQVLADYKKASEFLYEMAAADGIQRPVVEKQMRKIAGDLMEKDPSFLLVFQETAYDTVVRGRRTVHLQKYEDAGEVKTRRYETWEGDYKTETGNVFDGAFTPRMPESVNALRKRSKQAWEREMNKADTPEEWQAAVNSPYARSVQMRYMRCMMEDNGLTEKQMENLNACMHADDDVSWMFDMDGDDPFGVGSLTDSIDVLVENGPKENAPYPVMGDVPEFKSAFCKWLNHHLEYNPGYYQKRANQLCLSYRNGGMMDEALLAQIAEELRKRDAVSQRWDKIFDSASEELKTENAHLEAKIQERRILDRPLPKSGTGVEMVL